MHARERESVTWGKAGKLSHIHACNCRYGDYVSFVYCRTWGQIKIYSFLYAVDKRGREREREERARIRLSLALLGHVNKTTI